jgi:HEAT repeat protein
VKTPRTKLILIILFLAAAIVFAINSNTLKEKFFTSSAPLESGQPSNENPLPKPEVSARSDAINQLLQNSPKIAPNDLASDASQEITPDDLQTMEEALNDFYSSEDGQDRETALMNLGEYPDPKAKEAILYALNDPEDFVREQAVNQISNWEDEKERQQMLLMALNNDKHEIVVLALESIAELDDPALIQKVKELSSNKNEDISEAAKAALETSGSY